MAATLHGVVTQSPLGAAKYCCAALRAAAVVFGKGPAQAADQQAGPGRSTPAGDGVWNSWSLFPAPALYCHHRVATPPASRPQPARGGGASGQHVRCRQQPAQL